MQFLESICIIDVDVDHYKNILDYLLGVLSIGKINPIFFLGTIKATIFAIYFDTLGVRDMQFQNQFVLSIVSFILQCHLTCTIESLTLILTQIEHLIEPSIFAIYFDTLCVRDMQFRN